MSRKNKSPKKNKANKAKLGKKAIIAGVRSHFIENPFGSFNYKQVAHIMGVNDRTSKNLIKDTLEELAIKGELEQLRRGKFKIKPEKLTSEKAFKVTHEGKVDMKQTGKAYVTSPEMGEDIFIGANHTGHALHGDIVKVRLFPRRKGHKPEGEIVEIIKRAKTFFVGTIAKSAKVAFMISDSQNMPIDILIPLNSLNKAKHGEKVVVKMTEWPEHANNPFGEVIKILGKPGDNEVEMQAILVENDFPLAFSKEVEAEASKISDVIPAEEIKKRRDFRQITTFTIDPFDAKDFDDAISYRRLENGNHEIGVHIADVSYYVKPNGKIDKEAFQRGTSVYLVDRVIPMLPEKLSNHVCSLRPKEDKLCYSAVFELDDNAKVKAEWFGKTIINSDRRFDYEEVQHIIETGKGDLAEVINEVWKLASQLKEERFKKGAISFHTQEVNFKLDEKGKPIEVIISEQKESNFLIEDLMLLANRRVAERIGRKRGAVEPKTFVYRIHDQPSPEKLNQFIQFVAKLGYKMRISTERNLAKSFNELFEKIKGKGEENLVETLAVRTMAKAEYSTKNIGHYGLAFAYYTHFTSPIRRYPDLMVHRLLQRYLDRKPSVNADEYEGYCTHASDMERKAQEAERASIKYKQAEYMSDKIGQEFDGLISGVSKYGIFVEIKENKCEGMIRLQDLDDDFYYLDEENYKVIGHRYQREFKLGDPIRIRVKNIDIRKKQIDYEIA
ncbi:MAG TPA: ribonuclease R [Bacteroidales bacterium]|jgi:ribonuclease R|nr:ribonuclease R [Bacteroidales bacterium]NLH32466.1 ribonuclease R [Lentimicrobium sp.]MBP7874813.1 ribonuclease R [Bacteroidales bacterium]MCZ2281830.1 ribonuclease R [Bacteroidales bacterium]HNY59783.1 ribonuclease R [Bacteroidales bacterium]